MSLRVLCKDFGFDSELEELFQTFFSNFSFFFSNFQIFSEE